MVRKNMVTFRHSGRPSFLKGAKIAPEKMQSDCAIIHVAFLNGGSQNAVPSFEHQNQCHTPKIARTTNFLADFSEPMSRAKCAEMFVE